MFLPACSHILVLVALHAETVTMDDTFAPETDPVGDNPNDIDPCIEDDIDAELQGTVNDHDNKTLPGYPPEFNTRVPGPHAQIWSKFPTGMVTEAHEPCDFEMDGTIFFHTHC